MYREYIGVDLHKEFFQVCVITATGERRWEGRFPRTATGVAQWIARGVGAHSRIAVDASGPTWAFVDALAPTGAQTCVVDPRKTTLKAGYAAKTDRFDARRLADALRRVSVVSIDIPAPAIRELREICRGRHQRVRVRTRLAQMIRALLLRNDAGEPPDPVVCAARARVVGARRGRFARGPALASYAGLVTSVERSASRAYHGRITRDGSPWVRWALVEAAMHAIRRKMVSAAGRVGWPCGKVHSKRASRSCVCGVTKSWLAGHADERMTSSPRAVCREIA